MNRKVNIVFDQDGNDLGAFTNAMAAYNLAFNFISGKGTKEIKSGGVPSYRKASADLTKYNETCLQLIDNHGRVIKAATIKQRLLSSTWP